MVVLGGCASLELCPIHALSRYLICRGFGAGLLVHHVDGQPLTKFQFWGLTSRALCKPDMEGVKLGTHSF